MVLLTIDYQIILLDWKLPGMNGIQAAKEIRRNLGDEVPILLILHTTGVNLKQRPVKQVSAVLSPSPFLNPRCIMLCVSIWILKQNMTRHRTRISTCPDAVSCLPRIMSLTGRWQGNCCLIWRGAGLG